MSSADYQFSLRTLPCRRQRPPVPWGWPHTPREFSLAKQSSQGGPRRHDAGCARRRDDHPKGALDDADRNEGPAAPDDGDRLVAAAYLVHEEPPRRGLLGGYGRHALPRAVRRRRLD